MAASAAVRRYWDVLVRDGCCICRAPAEVAHSHGGSIVVRMQEPKAKGKKLAAYDFLVLPLCPAHHRDTSPTGLDRNVEEWEAVYGEQAEWIDRLIKITGVDAWEEARQRMKVAPKIR